jgi:hypothetical protein
MGVLEDFPSFRTEAAKIKKGTRENILGRKLVSPLFEIFLTREAVEKWRRKGV